MGNLNDINSTTEQLCRALQKLRKRMTSTSETLSLHNAKELEKELKLTIRELNRGNDEYPVPSSNSLDTLLNQHADRLAKLLETKVVDGINAQRRTESSADSRRSIDPLDLAASSVGEG
jgi:hypothetical protein